MKSAPRGGQPRFQTVSEAAQAQNEQAVLTMLSEGYDVDAADMDGNTALHWATWFRLDSLRAELMRRGGSAATRNSSGESAVHWAAKAGDLQALKALTADNYSFLAQPDCDGFTPFLLLAQGDHGPVMEWLYLRGISVEDQDHLGRTALHWACYRGHRRTVQWLLSRSASITHRDHDGMTAMHWAALKGHMAIADMLIDVGAVHLLQAPDSGGDTPADLATRKRNRYLVVMFYKCMLFNFLFGRPNLWRNNFAPVFVACVTLNLVVFAFVVAPGIAASCPRTVIGWSVLMAATLFLWKLACLSDPGWVRSRTLRPQVRGAALGLVGALRRTSGPGLGGFDASQPVESQMERTTDNGSSVSEDDSVPASRLELEQRKMHFQRQLLSEARRRLEAGDSFGGESSTRSAQELLPLVDARQASDPGVALQQEQLDSASAVLQQRVATASRELGHERVAALQQEEGGGEYIELLERGSFRQICVVCRAVREPRSHHCKECGRCVRRLDHHCPWIDNCVGLGNQRVFFGFLVVLLASLLGFYWGSALYVVDDLVPAVGAALGAWARPSGLWLGSGLGPPLVLLTCALNVVWVGFVGALVVRTSAYTSVNVTTFEVLTQPAHVQRRFPKRSKQFWFLDGCTFQSSMLRCWSYWTLDMEQDALDFPARDGSRGGAPSSPSRPFLGEQSSQAGTPAAGASPGDDFTGGPPSRSARGVAAAGADGP